MKKLVVIGVIAIGMTIALVGCGSSESEYQSYLDKAVKQEKMTKSEAEKEMREFKGESPEKQKMMIEMTKALVEEK